MNWEYESNGGVWPGDTGAADGLQLCWPDQRGGLPGHESRSASHYPVASTRGVSYSSQNFKISQEYVLHLCSLPISRDIDLYFSVVGMFFNGIILVTGGRKFTQLDNR